MEPGEQTQEDDGVVVAMREEVEEAQRGNMALKVEKGQQRRRQQHTAGGDALARAGVGKYRRWLYRRHLLSLWCPSCSCGVLQVMACGEMRKDTDRGDG